VREVTLIEIETLEAMARGEPAFPGEEGQLAPADHPQSHHGRRAAPAISSASASRSVRWCWIGESPELPASIWRSCWGCRSHTALINRSGLNCRIEVGGTIRKGDAIIPLED
jgi:hypothetical protein